MKRMTLWGEEEILDTRICIHCGQEKHVNEMELDRPHHAPRGIGYRNECKKCRRQIQQDIARLKKEYAHLRPHITDKCPVCQRTGTDIHSTASQGTHKKKDPWVLDHCHDKNVYRGWICNHCNNGLSGFKDNVESLERGILYLKGLLRNDPKEILPDL
tara:strand:- start:9323 stop:9796 length:474 start_codon:yes stop_codon:yes gene_type:complete